ncbi:hypothetical protein PPL_06095 [Heterostelium album PN500]|uniref:Uncharacterized protein n=1 Tax=Heterostelium pallidum (strain ATCC 26659 / Pp 5 / PN500) TaxID=670386 RepID=D3BC73_HETP5|nr:hypothetical protein PPL_06095 [Heterostelium album PN500]EFA81256.1 hypothetical protein PPL_06095 [Heterostelium album PN500]|eukprot:XP_020433374.1 hypothetical protein PPL_06095 [Heterostelium album PN500]
MSWIGWFMCFGIVCLVPIDVLATQYRDCLESKGVNQCERAPWSYVSSDVLYYFYQTFYFGTLLLTWLVYPFLGSLVLAGDFKLTERIQRSIRENHGRLCNGRCQHLGYHLGNHLDGLRTGRDTEKSVEQCESPVGTETPAVQSQLAAAPEEEGERRVVRHDEASEEGGRKDEKVRSLRECPPELYSTIQFGEGTGEITYSTLVALNSRLKSAVQDANRSESLYNQCVEEAYALEDILASGASLDRTIHWSFKDARTGRFAAQLDRAEWIWFTYLEVPVFRLVALLFAICSVILVWSEISVAIKSTDVSILSNIVLHSDVNNLGIQIVLFFPLGYAALVTYSTLFKIRIFNYYRLISGQHSDSNSILFSAAYLCRLAAPLCYNFITFIKTKTTFTDVMGESNFVPFLGQYFYIYFPIVITVVVLATAFNLYSRLMNCLNITRFRFDNDFSHENIDEGKMILEHEKRRREVAKKTAAIDRSNPWSNTASSSSNSRFSSNNDKRYTLLRNTLDDEFNDDIESGTLDTYNGKSGGNALGQSTGSANNTPSTQSPQQSESRLKSSFNGFPSMSTIFGRNDRDKLIRNNNNNNNKF